MELEELLAEADEIMQAVEPITVPVTLGKSTVGVRFLPMSGAEWRALTARHEPRDGSKKDQGRGYNIAAVAAAYPDVVLVIGDKVDDLLREDDAGHITSIWPDVYRRISATGQGAIEFEMWAAHEYTPEHLVVEAGKA